MKGIPIMNVIHSLLTRNNITLALSIFGAVGTLLSWIFSAVQNRQNIKIEIVGHRISRKNNFLLVYMLFENKSHLPILITNISVKLGSTWYPCRKFPSIVFFESLKQKDEITFHNEHYSLSFPIYIISLGGSSGYIYFDFPESSLPPDATYLTFQFSANRGKAIEMKLSLGDRLDQ